ncbi:MAG TPA: hypothetical protein VIY29_22940 [Ktedonobacteraceae bacterium]
MASGSSKGAGASARVAPYADARARGIKLGGRRTSIERHFAIRQMGRDVKARKREQLIVSIQPIYDQIVAEGAVLLREIASEMDARGVATRWGARWTPTQVHRLLGRHRRPEHSIARE